MKAKWVTHISHLCMTRMEPGILAVRCCRHKSRKHMTRFDFITYYNSCKSSNYGQKTNQTIKRSLKLWQSPPRYLWPTSEVPRLSSHGHMITCQMFGRQPAFTAICSVSYSYDLVLQQFCCILAFTSVTNYQCA